VVNARGKNRAMSSGPANAQQHYVPTDLIWPENEVEMRLILTDYLKKIVEALNDKEVGQYNTQELVTGESWFTRGDATQFRYPFRKVIDFGALPNNASTSVAHGITTNGSTVFTKIYGTATDQGASSITAAIPIPYAHSSLVGDQIELSVDATNVIITTAIDYSAFTETYIVLEYIQGP